MKRGLVDDNLRLIFVREEMKFVEKRLSECRLSLIYAGGWLGGICSAYSGHAHAASAVCRGANDSVYRIFNCDSGEPYGWVDVFGNDLPTL